MPDWEKQRNGWMSLPFDLFAKRIDLLAKAPQRGSLKQPSLPRLAQHVGVVAEIQEPIDKTLRPVRAVDGLGATRSMASISSS